MESTGMFSRQYKHLYSCAKGLIFVSCPRVWHGFASQSCNAYRTRFWGRTSHPRFDIQGKESQQDPTFKAMSSKFPVHWFSCPCSFWSSQTLDLERAHPCLQIKRLNLTATPLSWASACNLSTSERAWASASGRLQIMRGCRETPTRNCCLISRRQLFQELLANSTHICL